MKWMMAVFLLFQVLSVSAQQDRDVTLLGHWDIDGLPVNASEARYNEVWGFEVNGEEFGVIGSTLGSHIIHLKRNSNLEEVAFIPGAGQGEFVVHRDYASYGTYLFAVADQLPATLQILDVSGLPDEVEMVYESAEIVSNAHNIFIDKHRARAYACGSAGQALKILDIANPAQPELLLDYNAVTYVHDCYVRRDTAYLNAAFEGLWVTDFSDIENPQVLGSLDDYPDDGYNHSGWLNPSGEWYCFADETVNSSMKLCDVTDLTDIDITDTFASNNTPEFLAHNLFFKDSLIFVSHYMDGLQVFDWSDPDNVRRVAWYDSSIGPDIPNRGVWGVYPLLSSGRIIISDRQRGLFLLKMGQEQMEDPELVITPVPAEGFIEVNLMDFGFDWDSGDFAVYAVNGQRVMEGTIENPADLAHWFKLDVSELRAGMYILEFRQGEEVASARFVKR